MTLMDTGIVKCRLKMVSQKIAVGWGYCQVFSSGVNILAESAAEKEEIEISVVKEHLKQQQKDLFQKVSVIQSGKNSARDCSLKGRDKIVRRTILKITPTSLNRKLRLRKSTAYSMFSPNSQNAIWRKK